MRRRKRALYDEMKIALKRALYAGVGRPRRLKSTICKAGSWTTRTRGPTWSVGAGAASRPASNGPAPSAPAVTNESRLRYIRERHEVRMTWVRMSMATAIVVGALVPVGAQAPAADVRRLTVDEAVRLA